MKNTVKHPQLLADAFSYASTFSDAHLRKVFLDGLAAGLNVMGIEAPHALRLVREFEQRFAESQIDKNEVEIAHRWVYSSNHETDEHSCGLKQGAQPSCRVESYFFRYFSLTLRVGETYVENSFSSPPAAGRREYRITRITDDAIYGVLTFNNVRVLDASEVE